MNRKMTIAVIGTGLLGSAIAKRLQRAGQRVIAYNRTVSKALPLRQQGIAVVARPDQALEQADCAVLTLADTPAIRSVVLASPCEAVVRGKTLIQMGTIGAEDSRTLHTMLARRGADYFEAPVLGSRAEAKAGTLLVMVGSTETQFTKWRPLFRLLGRTPRRIGPVGTASTLKLALNQLIAAEMGAFALSVGFIQRSHVSMDVFMDILRGSALFAPTFEKKLPRLMKRHYQDPNFSTAHLLKDVNLFIRAAKPLKVRFEALEKVGCLLREAINHGLHASDYSALYEIINPPVSHEHR